MVNALFNVINNANWCNVKFDLCTLHSRSMMSKRRIIPMQMDRMITHNGTAAGFCT